MASYYRITRVLHRWCVRQGYVKSSPKDGVDSPKQEHKVVWPYYPKEVREMKDHLSHNADPFLRTRNDSELFQSLKLMY